MDASSAPKKKTGLIIGIVVLVVLLSVIGGLVWYFWDTLFPPPPSEDSAPAKAPAPRTPPTQTRVPTRTPPTQAPTPTRPPPTQAPSPTRPSPTQAPTPIARSPRGIPIGYTELTNTDAPGNDIGAMIPNDIDLCVSQCNADSSCEGYVINPTNNNCWKKRDIYTTQVRQTNRNIYYKSGEGTTGAPTLVGKTFRSRNAAGTSYEYFTFTDSSNATITRRTAARGGGVSVSTNNTTYMYFPSVGINPGTFRFSSGPYGMYNSTDDNLNVTFGGFADAPIYVRFTGTIGTGENFGGAYVGLGGNCNPDMNSFCDTGLVESYVDGSCVCLLKGSAIPAGQQDASGGAVGCNSDQDCKQTESCTNNACDDTCGYNTGRYRGCPCSNGAQCESGLECRSNTCLPATIATDF